MLITQLKAENYELKQRERDYNNLSNKLIELEQRYRAMQKEIHCTEVDFKERENDNWRRNNSLRTELNNINDVLTNKDKELIDTNNGISSYKSLVAGKDIELDRLRKDKYSRDNDSIILEKDKRALESDVMILRGSRLDSEKQADNLAIVNKRLNDEHLILESKAKDTTEQLMLLRKQLENAEVDLGLARREKEKKEVELVTLIDAKSASQAEIDRQRIANISLDKENRELSQRVAELSNEFSQLQQRYNDAGSLLDNRERELSQVHSNLSLIEHRNTDADVEFMKIQRDNEVMQNYLSKYREDAELQKHLREIESSKKVELVIQKKRLEEEARAKEYEARSVKIALERERDEHGRLLQGANQTSEELDALKRHAELLEGQNMTLNTELEKFVETDEVVKKDLDRKSRIEYIKNRNIIELEKSLNRVRNSQSPKRSPYGRSEYY